MAVYVTCKCGGRKSGEAQMCAACRERERVLKANGGRGRRISPRSQTVRLGLSVSSLQYQRFLVLAQRHKIPRSELLGGWIDSQWAEEAKRESA